MYCYCIRNIINNKLYFGVTKNNVKIRWNSHINKAFNGSDYHFHNAIRKYGKENFEIKHIDYSNQVKNYNELLEIEMYYIEKYDTYNNGYNSTIGGEGTIGLGIKPVEQYSLNLNKIQEFSSINEASNKTGISKGNISSCCTGRNKTGSGYIWRFKGEEPTLELNWFKVPVLQFEKYKDKQIKKFNSIIEANRELNIDSSMIIKCCKKQKQKSAGGFRWCYEGDSPQPYIIKRSNKKVNQFDIKTKKYINTFESITIASKETNTSLYGISDCCRGKIKSSGGYYWEFNTR